jgi:hypothetical protein
MATNSETGHAKNVANFEQLVIKCTSFEGSFNPSNPSIQLAALQNILSQGKECMAVLNSTQANFSRALANREVAFQPFSTLITRIGNAVKASGAPQQTIDQVVSLIRKLQGRRATPNKTDEEKQAALAEGKEITEVSSSQMSFDSRMENFDKLIKLLGETPEYHPNENDLTVSSLADLYEDLKVKNLAVVNAETALNNLRMARNEILYKANTGVLDVATAAKMYVKSVFGATSPQYKQLSSLKFTNPR